MSLFSERHYEVIARVLAHIADDAVRKEVIYLFVSVFEFDSENFNRPKFVEFVEMKRKEYIG